MEFKKSKIGMNTIDIVKISLMAAMIFVGTAIINIPSPYKGVIHLGDSMIFIAAVILGKKKGAIASAIGMTLFDVFSPWIYWAPFTFIIKGIMAYLAGKIALRRSCNGKNYLNNILAFSIAGMWMVIAYYLAGVILSHYYFRVNWLNSFILPSADIISNVVQVVAGIVIALPLLKAIDKTPLIK